jgi:hypothetical protein
MSQPTKENNMDPAVKAIVQHTIAYAMLVRASGVITDRQYGGIKAAFENIEEDKVLDVVGLTMHALNDTYERQLKKWIENNQVIIRP